ncbi:MAG: metalloregulator ArsR/SmtB family transcription factor [Verrucomicrobia bacterium]|nr:metalloregulator ArsR/SmtB family transcription factor [Verrucomicrobiota bacterium]
MSSIVKSLKLLADPTRLRLLLLLGEEELSVAEIQEILGMGQSRISSHLAQLKAARLVVDRRAGKNIYYGRSGHHDGPFKEIIAASAADLPEAEHDRAALKLIRKKRQDTAREYFNKLAGKFGRSYCPGRSWKGFAHMLLAMIGPITVADLGAGEGTLSQLMARRAKAVIAVDNSEKMVEFGAQLAKEHGFENLEYRLGDIEEPPIADETVDLVLLSQALHHAGSPARAIAAARRILKPGGRIAILDLLAHQFENARDMYADLWLGFTEVQLDNMLREEGFREIDISVVDREPESPHFQTVFATGVK